MNIKQFLKLDWRKIVLTLVISSLGLIFLIMDELYSLHPNIIVLILDIIFNLFSSLLFIMHPGIFFRPVPGATIHTDIGGVILVNIFYWYLLSCLIIWIYDKFRKKK